MPRWDDFKYWLKHGLLDLEAALLDRDPAAWHALGTRLSFPPWSRRGGPFPLNNKPQTASSTRVAVLLTPCCWYPYTSPIVQLTLALQRRGFDFEFLTGNAGDCAFFGSNTPWSSGDCDATFDYLGDKILPAGARLTRLNALVTESMRETAQAFVEANSETRISELHFTHRHLWPLVRVSAARMALRPVAIGEETLRERPDLHALVAGAIVNQLVFERHLVECPVDALLVFSGFGYQERIAADTARARGIRVIAHENSSLANRRIFDASGFIGNRTSVAEQTWPRVAARTLNANQREHLARACAGVFAGHNNSVRQSPASDESELRAALKLAPEKPIALLLAQLPFDSVMIEDLPLFADSLAFIRAVIDCFRNWPERLLVIRLHPAEARHSDATWQALHAGPLPGNVRLVRGEEANTHALMRLARCGITATSQAGLELLWLGKPLVVAGSAFYANKGITLDLQSREELEPLLDQAMRAPPPPREQVENLLYHLWFEHQLPYDPRYLRFPPRSVDRIAALLRGADWVDWDRVS